MGSLTGGRQCAACPASWMLFHSWLLSPSAGPERVQGCLPLPRVLSEGSGNSVTWRGGPGGQLGGCRQLTAKEGKRFLHWRPGLSSSRALRQHQMAQFSSVQSLSHVQLFATPWTAACQASLSITNSRSLLKLMSIESVMPSNHLILCCPLLLLPSIFPSIRIFSNESVLHIR